MKFTTLSRSLQMSLCAAALCSFGAANAQTPPPAGSAPMSQSQAEIAKPAQAPAVQPGSRDGMQHSSPSHSGSGKMSQSESEAKKPAQAPVPAAGGSRDAKQGTAPAHSKGMSQSEMEVKKPAQAPAGAGGK